MDLADIGIFACVVEARTFAGAARRLSMSKSKVSKHVARLEKAMGVQLIVRTTRSVGVTEVGQAFYECCTDVLAAAERAELCVTHMQSAPRGILKLAAPVSFGTVFVAPALPQLLADCPELSVEMTLTNRVVNVVEEGFDVALVTDHDLPPGLAARPIAPLRRGLFAAPAYVAMRGTPVVPADLRHHNCLPLMNSPTERRWSFRGPDGTVTVPVRGNLLVNNVEAIRVAALAGGGIAVLPRYVVESDIARGELVALLDDHEPLGTHVNAVFPPARHVSPKIRAFVDFIVARFVDGPGTPRSAGSRPAIAA